MFDVMPCWIGDVWGVQTVGMGKRFAICVLQVAVNKFKAFKILLDSVGTKSAATISKEVLLCQIPHI